MLDRYKQYQSYIDSGVPWQAATPSHWRGLKLKFLLNEKKKNTNPTLPAGSISFGVVVYKNEDNLSEDTKGSYREVLIDEFLINPLNLNYDLKSLRTALSDKNVVVSSGYLVVTATDFIDKNFARWLLYQFDVAHMKTLGSGVRQTLTYTDISNCYAFFPKCLDEQKIIGEFINHETAKIDALIAKQKKLIELLKEKRQAVISHAVIKGLNPDVPMKDSVIKWLGEVPKHWVICTLRRLILEIEQGKSPECESQPATLGEWGVLKTSCVNHGLYRPNENKRLPVSIEPHIKYEVNKGDLLMSRASGSPSLIGSVALADCDEPMKLLSDKIFRIQTQKAVNKEYFYWLMQSDAMRQQIVQSISGAEGMANNITKSAIVDFSAVLPSLEEQQKIASTIKVETHKFLLLIEKATKQLNLLDQRKSSLISAAVTGKIDVRNWQPRT